MTTAPHRRLTIAALAVAFALSAAFTLTVLRHPAAYLRMDQQSDFRVYYVASALVANHLDSHLYDEAGTGVDPQRRTANPDSVIATMARSKGISKTQLYVYPPFLADVLIPLTWFSAPTASVLWRALNLLAVALSGAIVSRLLGYKLASIPTLFVMAGLFFFTPLWQGMHYGQITLQLLLVWSAGILFYAKGWKQASAIVLSAGVLLKMTPLLIVIPILIWRDWKWVRWFAGGLIAGTMLILQVNSPGTLPFYFGHVVPPMSVGIVARENKTVLSLVEILWCHGLDYQGIPVPRMAILIGKLICAVLVGLAAFLTSRSAKALSATDRKFVLAAFALLSLCVSPVAWLDSLAIGYMLLALLWQRMLNTRTSRSELLLLFIATVAIGTTFGPGYLYWRLDQSVPFQFAPLILAIALVFYVFSSTAKTPAEPAAF